MEEQWYMTKSHSYIAACGKGIVIYHQCPNTAEIIIAETMPDHLSPFIPVGLLEIIIIPIIRFINETNKMLFCTPRNGMSIKPAIKEPIILPMVFTEYTSPIFLPKKFKLSV